MTFLLGSSSSNLVSIIVNGFSGTRVSWFFTFSTSDLYSVGTWWCGSKVNFEVSTCGLGILISPPINLASNLSPDLLVIVNLSTSGDDLLDLLLPFLIKALLPPPPNNLNLKLFFCFLMNLEGSSISLIFVVWPISSGIGSPVTPPLFVIEPLGIDVVI